jgi:HrpA-like RNA helicase
MKRTYSNFQTPSVKQTQNNNDFHVPIKRKKRNQKPTQLQNNSQRIEPQDKQRIMAESKAKSKEKTDSDFKKEKLWKETYEEGSEVQSSSKTFSHKIGNQKLPIFYKREEILRAINQNQVSIVSGNTGCGKSTQLPLFLFEDSLKKGQDIKIICTQPRRLACVNIARRVREEIGNFYRLCNIQKSPDYM